MDKSIHVWEIKSDEQPLPLALQADSLDEFSRLLPQGLYSTFRTFAKRTRVLDLRHHLERLYRPAAQMNIRPAVDEAGLRRALVELLAPPRDRSTVGFMTAAGKRGAGNVWPSAQGGWDEARVRISLSTEPERPGAVFVAIEPLRPLADEVYRRGIRVVTSHQERTNPTLKSTFFIGANEQARKALAVSDASEALMLRDGRILEGLTSNFYYIRAGILGTAGRGVLPGATRRLVLRLARAEGLPVSYRALRMEQLAGISEAFITSSSRGIVPVVQIDNLKVGQGLPGPLTWRLIQRYDAYVEKHAGLIA